MDKDLDDLVRSPEFQKYHKAHQDPPFNPFDVLRYADYEIRHSNVLAWLLDPGKNHGVGSAFLREFVQIAGVPVSSDLNADNVNVKRELKYADIVIFFEDARSLLVMENKMVERSREHYDQVRGYVKEFKKTHSSSYDVRGILLTASRAGDPSESDIIHASWGDVFRTIQSIHDNTDFRANDVQGFLRHYIAILKRVVQPVVGDDQFERLLGNHRPLLARLYDVQRSERENILREVKPHYRTTVGKLVEDFGIRPADLRSAVNNFLRGRKFDTAPGNSRNGREYWLYFWNDELNRINNDLNSVELLVWCLTLAHRKMTLGLYARPTRSSRNTSLMARLVTFMATIPITRSRSANFPAVANWRHKDYVTIYRNRILGDEYDVRRDQQSRSWENRELPRVG